MNTFYVDMFPQTKANSGYVSIYERGYFPKFGSR